MFATIFRNWNSLLVKHYGKCVVKLNVEWIPEQQAGRQLRREAQVRAGTCSTASPGTRPETSVAMCFYDTDMSRPCTVGLSYQLCRPNTNPRSHSASAHVSHAFTNKQRHRPSANTICGRLPPLSNHKPELWPSELKIGTPVTFALENVHTDFGFSTSFCTDGCSTVYQYGCIINNAQLLANILSTVCVRQTHSHKRN